MNQDSYLDMTECSLRNQSLVETVRVGDLNEGDSIIHHRSLTLLFDTRHRINKSGERTDMQAAPPDSPADTTDDCRTV